MTHVGGKMMPAGGAWCWARVDEGWAWVEGEQAWADGGQGVLPEEVVYWRVEPS